MRIKEPTHQKTLIFVEETFFFCYKKNSEYLRIGEKSGPHRGSNPLLVGYLAAVPPTYVSCKPPTVLNDSARHGKN